MEGEPKMVRIHLCQILYNPAYFDGNSDLLEEPAPSIDVTRTMGQLRQVKSVEGLLIESRASYVKHITEKLCAIARWSQSRGAKILVFPEYSVPCEALPHLRDIAREAGTHRIRFTEASKEIYKSIGLDIGTLRNGSAIAPIIHPTTGTVEISAKRYRSKWEPNLDVSLQTRDIYEVSLDDKLLRIGVATCIDALHVDRLGSLWTDQVSKPHIIICPSLSPSVEQFTNVGKILAGQETLFAFVNLAEFGGTAFNIPKEWEQYLPGTRTPGGMLHRSEAILEIDVNVGCFFIKKRSVETAPPCSSTRYFPIVYAATGKWMDRYSALEKQVLELLGSGDSGGTIARVDSFLSDQESPPPKEVATKLHELRQGQLALFAGDVDAVRESLTLVVLPMEIDDSRLFFARRIQQVIGLITSTLKSSTGEFTQSLINYLGVLKSMQEVFRLPQLEQAAEKAKAPLPKHLADRILAARPSVEGERKQVSVIFADVMVSSSSSNKLDPEDELNYTKQCLGMIADEIHRYEGTITQFRADGVIAFFGAPIAHEYATQRGLYASLGIQQRLKSYRHQLKEQGVELEVRIGVNTGPIVITSISDDLSIEYSSVGDTVSLASEMNHSAQAGTILASENTYGLTGDYFEYESAGNIETKRKKAPVKSYRVLGLGKARTRLRAAMSRGLTPLVGRERELELLLDAFERAKEGQAQALSTRGEAGGAKSRLLYEFKNEVAKGDITFLEGRCLPYSGGIAYHPIIDHLRSNFDIREGDDDSQITDKVKRGLALIKLEETSTLPYLLELLSVKDSGIDSISMSPEARRDRTMAAITQLILKGSELRPFIAAIEDLHWVDKSTEETLKLWLNSISGARVLLIFTYRPDYVHTWGARSYHSQITLNKLSNRESLTMVSHILGTEEIDRELQELVLKKTEGIPFFIEEFVRSLRDLGVIERKENRYFLNKDVKDLVIPSTIQEVITARVDSLPKGAKSVLQAGSAIEREFSYELIRLVMGLPELELISHLSVLRDSELLYERGIFPQSTYVFKHGLTREVVYDSVLKNARKVLHNKIGSAIEELHKDNLDEYYGVLAEHFIAGGNYDKAVEYCRLAERKAEKSASFNDAITYAQKRVSCLEKLPQTEDVLRKMVDARTTLGLYLTLFNHPIEAKEAVEPVVDLALKLGYKRRISQIYSILGWYSGWGEEDFPRAHRYLADALTLAEELNDMLSLATANLYLGYVLPMNCEYEKASYHFGKALDINTAANNLWGIVRIKSARSYWVYDWQGKINLGFKESYEALQIAEESGDIYSKAFGYTFQGLSCYCKGLLRESEEYLLKGINSGERINAPAILYFIYFCLGETYLNMGKHVQAREAFERGISLLEQQRLRPSLLNLGRLELALAKILGGDVDIELEPLYRYQAANKTKSLEGYMRRYLSAILLNLDAERLSEAEDWIKKAIEDDSRNGSRFSLAQDFAHYAELCKRKGDMAMAKKKLSKAIEVFRECGADGWVKKYEEALATIQE
jgi:class 3 adenylate cyclase/tetratricopeptide (TPR) repeat protein